WAARARAGRDVEMAWSALGELAADERAPVRLGARDALGTLAGREGGTDELVRRGQAWLALEERELRFGAAALVIDLLGERRLVAGLRDPEALLAYLAAVIAEIAE